VTQGRRFAFLPFLFDEEAAKLREANRQFLDDAIYDTGAKAGQPQATDVENS
jgi:hypothetical protein